MEKTFGMLPGMESRFYEKIPEEMTLFGKMLEIAHNAIEHGGASALKFGYNDTDENPKLIMYNNGDPIKEETFRKITSKYTSHYTSDSHKSKSGDMVSIYGCGLKDSLIGLADDVSDIYLKSYLENGTCLTWQWHINKKNPERSYYTDVTECPYDLEHGSGFEIVITPCKKLTKFELQDVVKSLSSCFSTEIIQKGKTIQVSHNGVIQNIKLFDPMRFDLFPKGFDIYKCPTGEYITDQAIFFVDEDNFSGFDEKKGKYRTAKVRIVSVLLGRYGVYKKTNIEDNLSNFCGVYPMIGGYYLERGNNFSRHLDRSVGRGGHSYDVTRMCPIITKENYFLFKPKSTKSLGLTDFKANNYFQTFKNEKGMNLFDFFNTRFDFIYRFYKKIIENNGNYIGKPFTENIDNLKDDIKRLKENKYIKKVTIEKSKKNTLPNFEQGTISEFIELTPKNSKEMPKELFCFIRNDMPFKIQLNNEGKMISIFNNEIVSENYKNEDLLVDVVSALMKTGCTPQSCVKIFENLSDIISNKFK